MTKIDHRQNAIRPARNTTAAYAGAPLAELAFYDAKRHIATSRNVSFGKRVPSLVPLSDCPHKQRFCIDHGLMAANCSVCRRG